jgi:hypothetical protein
MSDENVVAVGDLEAETLDLGVRVLSVQVLEVERPVGRVHRVHSRVELFLGFAGGAAGRRRSALQGFQSLGHAPVGFAKLVRFAGQLLRPALSAALPLRRRKIVAF